jgi:hypothetical protein
MMQGGRGRYKLLAGEKPLDACPRWVHLPRSSPKITKFEAIQGIKIPRLTVHSVQKAADDLNICIPSRRLAQVCARALPLRVELA